MNTEEKARAYDEALNWMREIYPGLHGATKEDAEHFFPELKESEDERIRTEIIDFIQWAEDRGMTRHDYHQAKRPAVWIAYLEKQKDLNNMIVVSPEVWDNAISDAYENGKKEGEKQKEQKPLTTEETELNSIAFLEQMGYTCIPPGKEQNPAEWSEVELEFRGEKVKVKRPFFRDDKGRGYSTTEQDEEVAWIALRAWCEKKGISLYDLYPRKEWSEEDKEIMQNILDFLEDPFTAELCPQLRKECQDWLKSLSSSR